MPSQSAASSGPTRRRAPRGPARRGGTDRRTAVRRITARPAWGQAPRQEPSATAAGPEARPHRGLRPGPRSTSESPESRGHRVTGTQ
eukprot:441310-Hanusia_phi.AAC.1